MNDYSPIAIVGMSGVFPEALTLEQFWRNIIHRKDACADIPEDRWKIRPEDVLSSRPAPDRAFHRRGCVVRNFHFNPDGFQVFAETLKSLDMLHHLALHTAREVLAPFQPSGMAWDRTGVIMASIALPTAASSHLAQEILGKSFENALFQKSAASSSTLNRHQCLAAQVTAFPAEILAKALGLGAFAFTLDAACASSIYAVKLACDALSSHRCDAVLAGGVSCPDRPYTQIGFSQLRALSPTGCCAPFDVRGDGLIVGEGAGILLLRRLEDAVADGNPVLGIIRGIGLSNDMRGNLLAPDIEGQVRAMRAAYRSAGWRPEDVDMIECHGAGTPVGDAAELLSLKALWESDGNSASGAWGPSGRCAIGSVKSMIGHLLTAAGAAGIIKTLLALKHQMLPPSLNFQSPPENSPLNDGPFQVQTAAASWPRRADTVPRRAAVSAFGFGGINAHILLEEWMPGAESASIRTRRGGFRSTAGAAIVSADSKNSVQTPPDIAVIGMDVCLGSLDTLQAFQEAVLSGISDIRKRPEDRWRGCDAIAASLGLPDLPGGYMESVVLELKDFHIPPHEIPEILIQHLLMLKVAGRAMQDAGLTVREPRPRMGAIIGMGFDMEATDFHLRWNIGRFYKDWLHRAGISLNPAGSHRWQESLKNACGPALTPSRTLGALAGVIASRVAREFGMGAPSFTVSGNAVSGVHALETAVRLLQRHEADAMLVGAVDMACDVRNLLMTHGVKAFSGSGVIRPLDALADGSLPGEGAAALVLKRRNQAAADGDRIYAVIKGVGSAMAASGDTSDAAYLKSLRQSLDEAGATPASIGMLEAHGSGHPDEDRMELRAFDALFQDSGVHTTAKTAMGSVKSITGHTGAAAGMVSIVKACLCLYQEIIPPLVNFQKPPALHLPPEPGGDTMGSRLEEPLPTALYFPAFSHYWVRNRQEGPRRACCAAISATGACGHVILEEECDNLNKSDAIRRERRAPSGNPPAVLFVIEGESPAALLDGLRRFETHVQQDFPSVEALAGAWFHQHPPAFKHPYAVSFVAENRRQLPALIEDAQKAVASETCRRVTGRSGVAYSPQPLGLAGDIAFVFPGSGNHFVGMGRSVGIRWPEVLRQMDSQTPELKTQMIPEMYVPYRQFWTPGWEIEAQNAISASPLFPIFGQVLYGSVMTRVMRTLGLTPQAVIGYSLGETAGFFALNAWPDSGVMLSRLSESALFHTELTGPCLAARKAWGVSLDVPFVWKVAVVNRPAALVAGMLPEFPLARLLIVNTPDECVIGGNQADVEGIISALSCEAIYLDGVVTVHCDAAAPVQEAYRELHRFPTVQPPGIRFYSCAQGRSISRLDTESAADSITRQAVSGFDFTATIRQAYQDGVRIFLEMGPHASCTRMIGRILGDSPHVAVSASSRGEDEYISILKLLATLASERIPVDLKSLYSRSSATVTAAAMPESIRTVIRRTGGAPFHPSFPEIPVSEIPVHIPASVSSLVSGKPPLVMYSSDMIQAATRNAQADADAHQAFLSFSDEVIRSFGEGFAIQSGLLERQLSPGLNRGDGTAFLRPMAEETTWPPESDKYRTQEIQDAALQAVAYSKEMCFEFAIGSVAKVLGAGFAEVDTYPARVRLPDAPLMLVDRILSVEGQKGSLGSGRIVTEHDVLPGAWYLDGGHAPVCIAVEAGQADLFLCAWLGIDLQVRGQRTYRLLDAAVQFHRGLPSAGDTIRYEIHIDRFVRQADTWLFFFSFRGYIGQELLITMTNGCAGFFTAAEVENSGGIILTDAERQPVSGKTPAGWKTPVPMVSEAYNETQVDALRSGNLSGCFGRHFSGAILADSLRLPGGRMCLIDRILNLEPSGGRYGLGIIRAQADIHPDDWFLTCHFMDDPVMPGTLMYECCAHTLRVFIQRMGWISETPGVCYEPVPGIQSILKCRGPVTPHTRHVVYTIEIRELGYMPEPYVIADALMTADGHDIVLFRNISMKMTGVTRTEIESFWKNRLSEDMLKVSGDMVQEKAGLKSSAAAGTPPSWHVTRQQILSFCIGKPSDAFGEAFRPFDSGRFLARLPGPPYLFIDRVVHAEPPALVLKPGGWIVAEYDVSPSDWYFRADGTGVMPFAVLLEIALQPCGWLAAYAGSSLSSSKDLHFRNLGGTGMIHRDIFPDTGTLTMRCRMTRVSAAGDMIIEDFDFQVLSENQMIYDGHTTFGFFTQEALKQQKGLRSAGSWMSGAGAAGNTACKAYPLPDMPPFLPEDISESPDGFSSRLTQPARALRMMDVITCSVSDGGPHGLGYIQGEKTIHPDEWFFQAHFYQDPVWPGSLGIEALMQLVKSIALDKWPECIPGRHFSLVTGVEHVWTYRGQVVPENRSVVVKAVITQQETFPSPLLIADGILSVDGLPIYEMNRFGIRILHNS